MHIEPNGCSWNLNYEFLFEIQCYFLNVSELLRVMDIVLDGTGFWEA